MVSKWALEMEDEVRDVTERSLDKISSRSDTTNTSGSATTSSSQATTSTPRTKKRTFQVYFKEPETTLENNFEGENIGLRLALKNFQDRSTKLVVPGRDVSKYLPEALSMNRVLWIDQIPPPRTKECSNCLKELQEFSPPLLNGEFQNLSLKVQSIVQSELLQEEPSEERLSENILKIESPNRQAVRIFERLMYVLPRRYNPSLMLGETGFMLSRLQCFLDIIFSEWGGFPIRYNIEHDSEKKSKSDCVKGMRSDFFVEVPSSTFSAIFNSEIVGLIGEVKPPEKERYEDFKSHDFWKLIQMGKAEINEQIIKGIRNPRIVCIQVFGYEVAMYIMKMDQTGVYILYKAAEGYVPRSISDIPGTENIISIFQHSKTILQAFQKELDVTVPHTDESPDEPSLKAFIQKDVIFEKYKV
ncbi:hypothetical protein BGX21_002412 [Mortierella sp. AD011]|nr:hypothetical protein BGX21_002412 [Mortierella sp. AD011]